MSLDGVLYFFLGAEPTDPNLMYIYYTARILIGVILFNAIFDLFRFIRGFVRGRK